LITAHSRSLSVQIFFIRLTAFKVNQINNKLWTGSWKRSSNTSKKLFCWYVIPFYCDIFHRGCCG